MARGKKQTIVRPQVKHLISPALGADGLTRTRIHAYAVVVVSQERERCQAGSLRECPSICAKDQE